MPTPHVYLASQSPRRRELLKQIGVRFDVLDIEVPENIISNESPEDYVLRLAVSKAEAGVRALDKELDNIDKSGLSDWQSKKKQATIAVVIGSDTAVVCDGEILGKPDSLRHATEMLTMLGGQTHEVLTGVAICSSEILTAVSRSLVTFRDLNEVDIARYIATHEGADKAGGYAIQGIAAMFITNIQGSYSGVMGLPLYETANLLALAGVEILPSI